MAVIAFAKINDAHAPAIISNLVKVAWVELAEDIAADMVEDLPEVTVVKLKQ